MSRAQLDLEIQLRDADRPMKELAKEARVLSKLQRRLLELAETAKVRPSGGQVE